MLELLNNFVSSLDAKELELTREMEKENHEELEDKVFMVEYFGDNDEIETKFIIAKTATNAWIKALKLDLDIKTMYKLDNKSKIRIYAEDLDIEVIETYIESLENKKKTIYLDLWKTTDIKKAIELLNKYGMIIKGVKDINKSFYELEIIDKYNNYMLFHLKENTQKYFR